MISSIGVAMYHPEAVRFASYVSVASGRQGTGMSLFAVGGLSGWALGPILTTPVVGLVGLRGTAIVALVPLAATLPVAVNLRYFEQFRPTVAAGHRGARGPRRERLARLHGRCGRRARCAPARCSRFQAFVPLYVWRTLRLERGRRQCGDRGDAGRRRARDAARRTPLRPARLPPRRRVSLAATAPLALFIPVVPLLLLFPLIALLGLISEMNFYPLVVIAQRALPRHVGFASGVMLGLSIGLGSLASPLLGVLADNTSLRAAVFGAAGLAVLAALVSLALPREPA